MFRRFRELLVGSITGRSFRRMFQLFVQFVDEREKFLAVRFLAYRMAKVFDVFVEIHA